MFVTRKIGSLIRGRATPFQVYLACALGALLGFIPGFQQAPGLIALWIVCLLILKANLFLAGLVGLLSKAILLLAMPVAFHAGRLLLEGPTEGLFKALANAPVTAYFGFDYYVVTGGQLLGLLVGLACGFGVSRALRAYRRKMAALTADGDERRLNRWSAKPWAKVLKFLFLGKGKGKKSYEELLSQRVGNPFRIPGVIAAVVLLALGYLGVRLLSDPLLTAAIQRGLTVANGATADLENAHLDLNEGRLELDGLAMADPNDLDTNIFAARRLVADISGMDILRRRFSVDRLVIDDASSGLAREEPGERVGPREPAEEAPPLQLPDYQDLGSVLENAPEYRERLQQIKRWLESLGGADDPKKDKVALRKTLASRVRALGYANVRKLDMIEGSPTVWIRNMVANSVETPYLEGMVLDITAEDLSSHPSLVEDNPSIKVVSKDGRFQAELDLGAAAGRTENQLSLRLDGLAVDEVAANLKRDGDGQPPVSGGTMDLAVNGVLSAIDSDLRVEATLKDTTLRIGGSSAETDRLTLPLYLRGPIDNPSVKLDSKALTKALADVGKRELARKANEELGIELPQGAGEGNLEDQAKSLLGGFLKKKIEEETKKEEKEKPKPTENEAAKE